MLKKAEKLRRAEGNNEKFAKIKKRQNVIDKKQWKETEDNIKWKGRESYLIKLQKSGNLFRSRYHKSERIE